MEFRRRKMKQLLSRHEAAEIFGITEQTISNYVKQGIIKSIQRNNHTLITRTSIERVLDDLRTDDEIASETTKYRLLTKKNNMEARKEYANSHTNTSVLHMLNKACLRDILKTMIKSIGHRHLSRTMCQTIIGFIDEWNEREVKDKFYITNDFARHRMHKALRTIESLPSYSDLEDKIERIEIDNINLSEQCNRLQGKIDELNFQFGRYKNINETGNPFTVEDLDMYNLLQTKVEDVGFSKRAFNVLRYLEIKTLCDLVEYNKTDLLRVRNAGKITIYEIERTLESLNLSLGMDTSRYKDAYYEYIKNKYNKK